MSSLAVDKFGAVGEKISRMENVSLQQIINRIPLLKYRYLGPSLSDYVAILPNDTFATKIPQASDIQGED